MKFSISSIGELIYRYILVFFLPLNRRYYCLLFFIALDSFKTIETLVTIVFL